MARVKKIEVGAPAYMAQYTALMTILLAFFILLNTLSKQQEAGFKAGIGDVKNAFGLQGGLGVFSYTYWGKGGANAPNPKKDEQGEKGIDKNLIEREGGAGNTDAEFDDAKLAGRYLRIKIPGYFKNKSVDLPENMKLFLKNAGISIEMFDFPMTIRCYAGDYTGPDEEGKSENDLNSDLALRRAARIMRYIKNVAGVPYNKMIAVGYSSRNNLRARKEYIKDENIRKYNTSPVDKVEDSEFVTQEAYLYIFVKPVKTVPKEVYNNKKD